MRREALPRVPLNPFMRLASYNILDGGEGRADPLAEILIAQRADIVTLLEADNLEVLERIASRLKMDFIHAPGNEKSSAALLSRWPIARTINHTPFHPELEKALLEAHVIDPATGTTWTIGVVHLHAGAYEEDEQRREREIAILLDVFAEHRAASIPHILAGDFNANALTQQIDPTKCKQSTRDAWKANGGDVPRRVVRKILDAGYVDTLHAFDASFADRTGTFTTHEPAQRVDYIFSFGSALERAWVEQDRLAKYASDHFPIGADF